jgi:hypothetical protein
MLRWIDSEVRSLGFVARALVLVKFMGFDDTLTLRGVQVIATLAGIYILCRL